ncbi:hypothetical protein [Halobacillus mangrovi]|uniref:hypothetical protein n=1 Tax=Halobacillus mangrovi TaxID=402384 RepID=UPI003D957529
MKYVKISGYILGVLVIFLVGIMIGKTGAETTLNNMKLDIKEMEEEAITANEQIDQLDEELKTLQTDKRETLALIDQKEGLVNEVAALQKELDDKQSTLDEELKAGKEEIEGKLKKENDKLASLENEVKKLQSKVDEKKKEIDRLTGELEKAKEEPKTLIAGQYIVGEDLPAGRYQVTNIGDGTNFFVYDSSGYPTVNTILGEDFYGDYVFFTDDGDQIETHGKVKLIPVE